jgi:hypothetical protein
LHIDAKGPLLFRSFLALVAGKLRNKRVLGTGHHRTAAEPDDRRQQPYPWLVEPLRGRTDLILDLA